MRRAQATRSSNSKRRPATFIRLRRSSPPSHTELTCFRSTLPSRRREQAKPGWAARSCVPIFDDGPLFEELSLSPGPGESFDPSDWGSPLACTFAGTPADMLEARRATERAITDPPRPPRDTPRAAAAAATSPAWREAREGAERDIYGQLSEIRTKLSMLSSAVSEIKGMFVGKSVQPW